MAASQPLYERIEKQLRRRLTTADDGDPFPSEPQLAEEFGVSRMTVRAALAGLERDGMLERVPGRGSFVRKGAAARPVGILLSFHDQARAEGKTPRSRVLEATVRDATPPEIAALYQVSDPATAASASTSTAASASASTSTSESAPAPPQVVAITRVRLFDDTPIALERATFPATPTLSTLLTADLETGSLHHALRRLGLNPTLGSSILTARTAGGDARELGVAPTTPMLVETRSIVDQHGDPLEYTVSSYVADRYALKVDFAVQVS
ncbi:GntR family transcriptional regulator [Catenulispora sp. NF23]|uniref:GntR family transcriptional regulator n=1 Tax=Catenulispora pinistramenti TaxID=2705254 RepID=A0ABS5L7X0_9ACTN|nr:GntR family transcriptional regulator [Catenulispora pinistramenti]MBS2539670.1 GntR family transcriptional regulator [Catenulispora pinistramenti]MBS2554428.1 GntR family transcriptional regulator [Catenulispora pinistramenti]